MSTMLPGASRISPKITIDMPTSVTSAMPIRWARYVRTGGALSVQPDVLHAAPIIGRVVRDQVLHVGPLREVVEPPAHRRTGGVLLELLLDPPDQREPLLRIQLLRLLLDHPHDLLVAVVGVVPRRPAPVVLREVRVGVVDAEAGEIRAHLVLATG